MPERPASAPSPRPEAAPALGLSALPAPRRVVLAGFLLLLLGFYGAAQVQLRVAAGGGSLPGPREIEVRYHGDPLKSRLHLALDPERPAADPKRMYLWLGETDEAQAAAHRLVLGWVEAGAPKARWAEVAPVLTGAATCGKCHARGVDAEGLPRVKADMPFETWEDVVPVAARGAGMSLGELARTTHNHLAGFAMLGLLVGLVASGTRVRPGLKLVLGAAPFVGAALDVGGWWLTWAHGAPFHLLVLAGGALFGAGIVGQALLALDDLVLGGAVARALRLSPRAG